MSEPLLSIKNLYVEYGARSFRRRPNQVLRDVSLDLQQGTTLGLVGESGSGKTTLGRAVLGLVQPAAGTIKFDGKDITNTRGRARRGLARDIQVVFQDPYSSLNPSMTIENILSEPLLAVGVARSEGRQRVRGLLEKVGLPADAANRLPREFSGGQRQRIAIARAVALDPKLIICDEPVSALDLSTQSTVLDLLIDLQRTTGVTYLFISHDLSVVRYISHRVAVMRGGEIVENGPAEEVTENPEHPYTRKLLLAAPVPNPLKQAQRRADRLRFQESLEEMNRQALLEPQSQAIV
ncbi:ATP-binding cassette domain-containing protein [Leifsonia sp. NPDC056665]|uniref:ATP-binding cassette domain-containing protein n=1 Tax=Leifsonia sp. NPDC056665 TaxID=3345901 RepID=UPI00368CCC57